MTPLGTARYRPVPVAKEATPEQAGWRARIAREEKPLLQAFLDWVGRLRLAISPELVVDGIVARSGSLFDHALQAVAFRPELGAVMEREAEREFEETIHHVDATLRLSLDLRDPHFAQAVHDHEARLVREVTAETRRALTNMVERAYRSGRHPYELAPEIREAVGLTSRQAQAVLSYGAAQRKAGVRPALAEQRAVRYAEKMRTRRAKTIARTETARAMVDARLQSYEQAARHGLFDVAAAELEWSAVQDDPTEICAILDGTRVGLGETFGGLLPPAHPNCRCSVHLVLDR